MCAISLLKAPAFAQTTRPFSLGVTPNSAFWHVKPGDEITHTIILKNEGAFSLDVTPELVSFESDQQTGKPLIESLPIPQANESNDPPTPNSNNSILAINPTSAPTESLKKPSVPIAEFINIANPDFTWKQSFLLKPGEEKKVVLKISPPSLETIIPEQAQLLEMEHSLTVLFVGKPAFSMASPDSSAQVSGVVGSNLILYFSSQENDLSELKIEKLRVPRVVDSFDQISFSILAKNTGRNATPNQGKATITTLANRILAEYNFYPDMVLAQSSREVRSLPLSVVQKLEHEGKKELDEEELSQLTPQLVYKSPFLFGIYTLTVELGTEKQTTKFVALPFSGLIALCIAGVIFFLFQKLKNIS